MKTSFHTAAAHVQEDLQALRLGSALRLLQEGAPQPTHRHPSVQTQTKGRVLAAGEEERSETETSVPIRPKDPVLEVSPQIIRRLNVG